MKRGFQQAADVLSHCGTRCRNSLRLQLHEEAESAQSLISECLRGNNADAWRKLVLRCRPVIAAAIGRVARKYKNYSSGLVEQLAQETLTKLCEGNYSRLRKLIITNDLSFFGYIRAVARNLAIDHFRKEQKWVKAYSGDPEAAETHYARMCRPGLWLSEKRVLLLEVAMCLKRVVAGPTARRDCLIFWLYYWRGLTATEIADRRWIKLTSKGVESVLNRVLSRLRQELASDNPGAIPSPRAAPRRDLRGATRTAHCQ